MTHVPENDRGMQYRDIQRGMWDSYHIIDMFFCPLFVRYSTVCLIFLFSIIDSQNPKIRQEKAFNFVIYMIK